MKSGLKSEKRSHRLTKASEVSEAVLDGSKAKCPRNRPKCPTKCPNSAPTSVEPAARALARRKADQDHWETRLRKQLGRLHGAGWIIEPQSGKFKLRHRNPETGHRSAVTLDIEWSSAKELQLLMAVDHLRQRMKDQRCSLGEAAENCNTEEALVSGELDWPKTVEVFLEKQTKELRHGARY